MKNNRIFFLGLALTALMAVSCDKEQDILTETPFGGRTLIVNAGIPAETKVAIAKDGSVYKMSWEATGETAKLLERKANWSMNTFDSNDAVVSGEGIAFSFNIGAVEEPDGEQGYDIIYPRSAYISGNSLRATLELPASQTPRAGSPDPAASLLYGRVDGTFATRPASVNATFGHLAAYVKMNLKGIASSETITSISLATEDIDIAGRLEYNTNSGTISNSSVTKEYTITLAGDNLTADPAGFDVWFACKPFTLSAGKTLTITTVTNVTTHTAVLTAGADVPFAKGKVTELPGFSDTHTISFNSMGGSPVADLHVIDGRTFGAPTAPTKSQSLAQGLYLGDITDAEQGALFVGWYTDSECTEAYDYSTPVTSDFTLYAKWDTKTPEVDLSASDTPYHTAVSTLNGLSLGEETVYTLVIDRDINITTNTTSLNSDNCVLKIIGKTSERTIHATGITSNVFSVKKGRLVLSNNLHIYGTDLGDRVIVSLDAEYAKVVLEDGCRLSGTTGTTADAIVVKINSSNSEFIMNGGEICDNSGSGHATRQATILNLYGIFTMNGGVISGNSVTTNLNTTHVCGGVMFNGWTYGGHQFTKTGGEIKDNTASRVSATGDETGLRGQQVLIYGGAKKKIDSNVGTAQNLDASSCYSSPWANAAL